MHNGAISDKLRIELLRGFIGAEFLIKIPQHFGLGEGQGTVRRVRNRWQEILGQPEEVLEGARQTAPVAVVDHDDGDPLGVPPPGPSDAWDSHEPQASRRDRVRVRPA
jgi:hypothetical protein